MAPETARRPDGGAACHPVSGMADQVGAVMTDMGVTTGVHTEQTASLLERLARQRVGILPGVLTMCISAGTLWPCRWVLPAAGQRANNAAKSQAASLNYEAMAERDAANAQAEKYCAPRGASAAQHAQPSASGTALDEFALRNEQDIQALGEADVAMSILSASAEAARPSSRPRRCDRPGATP